MNTQETEILDFLKRFPNLYVSVTEISKNVGHRKAFNQDRSWSRPFLRRMEMDGLIESNPFGEYRLQRPPDDATTFKHALTVPGFALGETAIITLDQAEERILNAPDTDPQI